MYTLSQKTVQNKFAQFFRHGVCMTVNNLLNSLNTEYFTQTYTVTAMTS